MVKIHKKPVNVDSQSTPPIKNKKPISWSGRLVIFLNQTLSKAYHPLFKLKAYCFPKNHVTASTENTLTAKNVSESKSLFAQQIEQAEKTHQTELTALHYMQRRRANDTVAILLVNIETLIIMMNRPNYQSQLPSDQMHSFLDEAEKLKSFLKHNKTTLAFPEIKFGESLPNEQELTSQQVMDHIKEIFDSVKSFHSRIKEIHSLLPKELPERKEFAVYATKLVSQVHQQQGIYKNPSSDEYMRTLQIREQQALQAFETLKQQPALQENMIGVRVQ